MYDTKVNAPYCLEWGWYESSVYRVAGHTRSQASTPLLKLSDKDKHNTNLQRNNTALISSLMWVLKLLSLTAQKPSV